MKGDANKIHTLKQKKGIFFCSLFHVTNSPSFGNCYSFNTVLNGQDEEAGERVSSLSGPNFGLTLVLNLDQMEYMQEGQSPQVCQ